MLRRLSRLLLFNRFRLAYRRLRLHGSIVLLRLKTMHQQPSSCHKHDGKHRQCRKHKFATAGRKHFRIGRVHRSFLYFMAPLPSSGPSQLITSRITDMPCFYTPKLAILLPYFRRTASSAASAPRKRAECVCDWALPPEISARCSTSFSSSRSSSEG